MWLFIRFSGFKPSERGYFLDNLLSAVNYFYIMPLYNTDREREMAAEAAAKAAEAAQAEQDRLEASREKYVAPAKASTYQTPKEGSLVETEGVLYARAAVVQEIDIKQAADAAAKAAADYDANKAAYDAAKAQLQANIEKQQQILDENRGVDYGIRQPAVENLAAMKAQLQGLEADWDRYQEDYGAYQREYKTYEKAATQNLFTQLFRGSGKESVLHPTQDVSDPAKGAALGRLLGEGVIRETGTTIKLGGMSSAPTGSSVYVFSGDVEGLTSQQIVDLEIAGFSLQPMTVKPMGGVTALGVNRIFKEGPQFTAIPGPGAGPRPGSIGEGFSKTLTGAVMGIPKLAFEMRGKAAELKLAGEDVAAGAVFAAAGVISGGFNLSVGALIGGVSTFFKAPQIIRDPIGSVVKTGEGLSLAFATDPLGTAITFAPLVGSIAYGVGERLLGPESFTTVKTTRMPSRPSGGGEQTVSVVTGKFGEAEVFKIQSFPSKIPGAKGGGYQWVIERELLPVEKGFSSSDFLFRTAGEGAWPKTGVTGLGKPTGYVQTGAELYPVYDVVPKGELTLIERYRLVDTSFSTFKPQLNLGKVTTTTITRTLPYEVSGGAVGVAAVPILGLETAVKTKAETVAVSDSKIITKVDTPQIIKQRQPSIVKAITELKSEQKVIQIQEPKVIQIQQQKTTQIQEQKTIQIQEQKTIQIQIPKQITIQTQTIPIPQILKTPTPPSKYPPQFGKPGEKAKGVKLDKINLFGARRVTYKGQTLAEAVGLKRRKR